MNRGVLQSPQVQQMMVDANPSYWWSINNMITRPSPSNTTTPLLPQLPSSNFSPHFLPSTTVSSSSSSSSANWHGEYNFHRELPPESWTQILGGITGDEEDKCESELKNKLENWEKHHHLPLDREIKQENPQNNSIFGHGGCVAAHHDHFHQPTAANNWSQMIPAAVSPQSCVTNSLSNNNMLNFSTKKAHFPGHPPPDRSPERNCSTGTGGAVKKARVQASTINQATFKVKKEKLGDRITALHQLVSPFGKTDTASVLLEAFGYIRFLHSQVEALSLPYLGGGSAGNIGHQQPDSDDEEQKKDLRSSGLCLVPISCTMQVESSINGADYWTPALGGSNFQ